MVTKLVPNPLINNQIENISEPTVSNVIQFVFIYAQVEVYQNILKHIKSISKYIKSCWLPALTSYKALLKKKNKKRYEISLFASFLSWFLKKNIMLSMNSLNFTAWLPLLLEILGNMFIVIICLPVSEVINFEIYFSFPIKPFFYMTRKSFFYMTKI